MLEARSRSDERKGLRATERRRPLELERAGHGCSREPPEGTGPTDLLTLAHKSSLWTSDLKNCKRTNRSCFSHQLWGIC